MTSRLVVVLLLLVVRGCLGAGAPAGPALAPQAGTPARTSQHDPDSIRWVQDSAEYRAIAVQVYRRATSRVEAEARSHAAGTWAVVLDADETVISNVTYQLERARLALPFTQESWTAWVRRREATPLPGAAAFLSRARALGAHIAMVTNRVESECDDTRAVFAAHALAYDAMLCRPNGGPGDKNPRFDAVANGRTAAATGPLDVVAFIGDNILDFPRLDQRVRTAGEDAYADFDVRLFMLPNPMYGSWQ